MKLLKTLRLDPSDTFIFPKFAENEWAVIGTFLFWEKEIQELSSKERQAFRAGFVGVKSLGFSTLVEVQEGDENEAISILCEHILNKFNAPSKEAAFAAAQQEIEAASALAQHEVGTLIAMHRTFEEGAFRETFRTLKPREGGTMQDRLHSNAKAFTFHEIEEDVDLLGLMK
jgi:Family of unknown function (DUF6505)